MSFKYENVDLSHWRTKHSVDMGQFVEIVALHRHVFESLAKTLQLQLSGSSSLGAFTVCSVYFFPNEAG